MEDPAAQDPTTHELVNKYQRLPPTPPHTEDNTSDSCNDEEEVELPPPPPSTAPSQVLEQDKRTPDAHVPRDSRLIRLTGVHPFNVEPPLSALFNEGFLTSPELFFVRNHGAVPEVQDEDIPNWELSVEGMVEKPFALTLRQLITDYEQITSPITLTCAGNRRKEQNLVKKTKGFSWGAAGVSTALFTGVSMADLIKRACPLRKARYICMEGADQLPNGNYGTSVKLNWVMDPHRGIMLAYKMNGEMLRPDHGRPLRAVVPGQIGGRSVKWLKRLIVTATPSENWYHIYDNRVLPTMVSPEESANNKDWWTDERYAIHDLSPNSAIACPAHEAKVSLVKGPRTYQVQGYAYSGGGRRVARVELSLDKGATWLLAHTEYPEDQYKEANQTLYGGRLDVSWREACFCWALWSLEIPVSDLADASDLVLRCMDESMCIQPKEMYWSVLGMMNNPWFRVTITKEGDDLRFEHPTQPALMPGGWMERVKKAGGNLLNGNWGERQEGEVEAKVDTKQVKEVSMTKDGLKHEITIDELRAHDNESDPWFVVNGEVYDGTPFMKEHPGGATSITAAAGQDTTDEFMAIHSETAKAMMPTYHLGTLSPSTLKALTSSPSPSPSSPSTPAPIFLTPRSWTSAPLASKRRISTDTLIFTFTLAHPSQTLGLPIGQHILLRLRDPVTRAAIIRAYTPISHPTQPGTLEVLIKLYLDTHSSGQMSKALAALPLTHPIDIKGPLGKFIYHGRGRCSLNNVPRPVVVKRFVMVCAGSGITPIFQVFRAVMQDEKDKTTCVILNGNRCEGDILCRDDLDALVEGCADNRGKVIHTLTRPPEEGWQGLRGRIGADLIREYCERDDEGTMALVCGPEPLERSVHAALRGQGWGEEQIVFF